MKQIILRINKTDEKKKTLMILGLWVFIIMHTINVMATLFFSLSLEMGIKNITLYSVLSLFFIVVLWWLAIGSTGVYRTFAYLYFTLTFIFVVIEIVTRMSLLMGDIVGAGNHFPFTFHLIWSSFFLFVLSNNEAQKLYQTKLSLLLSLIRSSVWAISLGSLGLYIGFLVGGYSMIYIPVIFMFTGFFIGFTKIPFIKKSKFYGSYFGS